METSHDNSDLRVTAPQQDYGSRAVGIGFLVLFGGLLITVVLPLLLA